MIRKKITKMKKEPTTTIQVFKKDVEKLVDMKSYPYEGLAWTVRRLLKNNNQKKV